MDEAGFNQTRLANELGCSRALVSQWLSAGKIPPEPDVVFAIEDVLGCRDMLAETLGYRRADDVRPSIETAVAADPDLTADQKELLAIQVGSMRQAAAGRRSRRSPRRS